MKLASMNWMQVEAYLRSDDRVVLPLGSTEQHAYLSLATDALLAERIATDAAHPLGVPVCPVLAYGLSPAFMAYPGTMTLRPRTYAAVVAELLDSLVESGFRRVLVINGQAANALASEVALAWAAARPGIQVRVHDWWEGGRKRARIHAIDPVAHHASWVESFPWTRLPDAPPPEEMKAPVELPAGEEVSPGRMRGLLGDGSMGGYYERDSEVMELWAVAVQEARALLEEGWEPA